MPNHGALEAWEINEMYQPLGNVPTGRYVSKRSVFCNTPQVISKRLYLSALSALSFGRFLTVLSYLLKYLFSYSFSLYDLIF